MIGRFVGGHLFHLASQSDKWSDETVANANDVVGDEWEHESGCEVDRPVLLSYSAEVFEEEQLGIGNHDRNRQKKEAGKPIKEDSADDRALNVTVNIQVLGVGSGVGHGFIHSTMTSIGRIMRNPQQVRGGGAYSYGRCDGRSRIAGQLILTWTETVRCAGTFVRTESTVNFPSSLTTADSTLPPSAM